METRSSGITDFFRENNGRFSSQRLVFVLFALAVVVVFIVIAFKTGTIPDIPAGVATLLIGLAGAKAMQKMFEKPTTETQS